MQNGVFRLVQVNNLQLELITLPVLSDRISYLSLEDISLVTSDSTMSTSLSYLSTSGKNHPTRRVVPSPRIQRVRSEPLSLELTILVLTMLERYMCSEDMEAVDTREPLSTIYTYSIVIPVNGLKCRRLVDPPLYLEEVIPQEYQLMRISLCFMEDGARLASIVMS